MVKSEVKVFNIPRLVTILMTASLLAGTAAGWFAAVFVPEYGRLLNGLGVHINIISDMEISALAYFTERALKYALPLAAVWFLAFLPPAAAIAPFFVFFKGVGTGLATRALLDLSGIDGLKQAAMLFFPQNLLLMPARCFIAADSVCQALGSIRARMIVNAGQSTNFGTEFSARWEATQKLRFNANHGYTRATFDNFVFADNDYSGNYVPFVPRNSFAAGAEYRISVNTRLLENIVIAAQYSYYSNIYFTERNNAWLLLIEEYLKTPETEFVVVGFGHLCGDEGLPIQLQNRGYTVDQFE